LLAGVKAPKEVQQSFSAHQHSLNDPVQELAEHPSKVDGRR